MRLAFISFLCFTYSFCFAGDTTIVHNVNLLHPGINFIKKQNTDLIEVQDNTHRAVEYYMDVSSVLCEDHLCKVVTVRLFWDKLGFYKKFDMPFGVELEKAEGKLFTTADYQKLHAILQDRSSPLKEYYRNVVTNDHGSENLDTVTGASSTIDENAVVKGASWTCCTLWHWANGNVFNVIRRISGKELSENELLSLFTKETEVYKRFVLEELIRRKNYNTDIVQAVLQQAKSSPNLVKKIIDYIENADDLVYFPSIKQLYNEANAPEKILYLTSLFETKKALQPDDKTWVTAQLSPTLSYQELLLLFKIIENKQAISPATIEKTMDLLSNPSFLVARSAYWFLNTKTLSDKQLKIMEKFKKENEDRL